MERRLLLTGLATKATVSLGGCLGEMVSQTGDSTQTDDKHLEAIRTEIVDRAEALHDIRLDGDVVEVDHGYDVNPIDAIANVAMAFFERIAAEWNVERLDGHLLDDGADWVWHAETMWAREYANDEITPNEYGEKISKTMSRELESQD